MTEPRKVDICVLGAGSGGLTVAAGAAQMGASTVLIEKARMGGDCLNYGCVPSKSLIAAARAAEAIRHAPRFGVDGSEPTIDFARVHAHVHGVIQAIAPNDSVERLEALGVTVIQAAGRFTGPREIAADGRAIRARRFVIATGSSPAVPPIPGLEAVPYFTNETIFDNRTMPQHLIVIGGGPIGVELGQAHRHLGARVTMLARSTVLGRDDPELASILCDRLKSDGMDLREHAKIRRIERTAERIAVILDGSGGEERIEGSHLLVAVGRKPNVDGLGLEAAGVAFSTKTIKVDGRLRTTNKRIFAIGDVVGPYQFTHMASYHAGIVLRNALFRLPAKVDTRAVPWVTFTDPELAHVGAREDQARERHGDIRVLRWPFAEIDRAQTERETGGLIKVVTTKNGRILGASILGAQAGELIHPWVLAIAKGMKIADLASIIAPYPTLGEITKRVAGSYFTPVLFGERTRKLVRFLTRFG